MQVTIDVKDTRELNKIKELLQRENLPVVGTNKEETLREISREYNVKLPPNYRLNRDGLHVR